MFVCFYLCNKSTSQYGDIFMSKDLLAVKELSITGLRKIKAIYLFRYFI